MSTPTNTKPLHRDENLLEKFTSLNRKKKKQQEIEELTLEGKQAIESPLSPLIPDLGPDAYHLEEGEERSMIEPFAKDSSQLKALMNLLIEWINSEFADQRILIRDIEEDLYDGQILQKIVEKLSDIKIDHPEVTQSEMGQKQRLKVVLEIIDKMLFSIPNVDTNSWSAEKIYNKDLTAILRLLVALARYYRAPIRIPEGVNVQVLLVRKLNGQLHHWRQNVIITDCSRGTTSLTKTPFLGDASSLITDESLLGDLVNQQDAFSVLVDYAPGKLEVIRETLVTFTGSYLQKINLTVTDLDTQFCDGVYLVLLMGLLEDYFVPLHCFTPTPNTIEQKVNNVQLAFYLMKEAGISEILARAEDIVNGDLKSILRVLYTIFNHQKNKIEQ